MNEREGIQGICRTNLDDYEMTVSIFAEIPKIGDYVICTKKGNHAILKVVSITHTSKYNIDGYNIKHEYPFIIVELNK